MKRNRQTVIITGVIILTLLFCSVYAAKTYELTFNNNFQTGSVDIDIEQYEVLGDGTEQIVNGGVVMPNQDVSYIPRVTNPRSEGYVRVKAQIIMDKEIPLPITLNNIYGLNSNWVQRGEYFYCTKVLDTGETSDIFQGIHIPEEWTQETASGFTIELTADVIQDDNFEPDFDAALPWGSVDIEQAKEVDNLDYNVAHKITSSPTWKYTSSKGLETKTEDLFKNFDYYMAGDSYKDTLTMQNKSKHDIKVYFRTDNLPSDLLAQMDLKIYCNGKKVYEGDLYSSSLDEWAELTIIGAGEDQEFTFEVSLPKESKNYYSVLKDKVVWKFRIEELPDESGVQTGDVSKMMPMVIAVLAALIVIAIVLKPRRKKEDEE